MAYLTSISTSTLSNQNIVAALLVHTYTNTTRARKIYINLDLDQITAGGDYVVYYTVQRAGAGSNLESDRTTRTVAAGIFSVTFSTTAILIGVGDVLKVYVVGLGGDTLTVDITTTVYEEYISTDASGYISLGAILGTALTEGAAGRISTAFKKVFDVVTATFTAESINQGADNNVLLAHATNGLAAIKAAIGAIPTSTPPTAVQIRQEMDANSTQLAAILEDTAHIGTGEVVVTSPMSADGESIELVRGDDYATEDNRQLEWTEAAGSNWPDLTGATVKFTARSKFSGTVGITKTATVVTPTGTKKVRCPLTDTETNVLGLGTDAYNYDLQATLASGRIVTLVRGTVTVLEDYTRPA